MKRLAPLALILACVALRQWHGVQFWMAAAGGLIGILWSLAGEAVEIWMWWKRRVWLAVIASGLMIAGPLHQVSEPVIQGLRAAGARAELLAQAENELSQREAALNAYLANSAKRSGWAPLITEAQAGIDAARARLAGLTAQQPPRADAQAITTVAIEGAVLLICMIGQILAIIDLRGPAKRRRVTVQRGKAWSQRKRK